MIHHTVDIVSRDMHTAREKKRFILIINILNTVALFYYSSPPASNQ